MVALSLFQLNNIVHNVLQLHLDSQYWVEAEIAEARLAQNHHCYLELIQKKTADNHQSSIINHQSSSPAGGSQGGIIARARAVIWAQSYNALSFHFQQATGQQFHAGLKVRLLVNPQFHEVYGYTLNILDIDPTYTIGDLLQRRQQILAQLQADGIINDNRNLPLPTLLKNIAVISSPEAAGYQDFCHQLQHNNRQLHFHIQLFPAIMQGTNTPDSIMAALAAIADDPSRWDCTVIIRGGGATTDLADFDNYNLAAALAQMPIPVITGIGHERDQTVLDNIAHTSVKTPTAAAEFILNHQAQQLDKLQSLTTRFTHSTKFKVQGLQFKVQTLQQQIIHTTKILIINHQSSINNLQQRLDALDPKRQLQRGYSLTYTADGHLLRSVNDIQPGENITTRVVDGTVKSVVTATQPHNTSP